MEKDPKSKSKPYTKPIILICGCRKYEEYLHAAIRRFANRNNSDFEIIGILGGQNTEEPVLDPVTRILQLPVTDTYEALPSKIHAAFTWIQREHPGIPGVFKTDDDMLFDVRAMVATISANIEKPYWGIAVDTCKPNPITEWRINERFMDKTLRPSHQGATYCFGWGYWISAATIPLIVEAAADYRSSVLEDVCTGFVLNRAGIIPERIPFPYKEMPRTTKLLLLK